MCKPLTTVNVAQADWLGEEIRKPTGTAVVSEPVANEDPLRNSQNCVASLVVRDVGIELL